MRENRLSGLMRGGKQTVIGPRASQPVASRPLYTHPTPPAIGSWDMFDLMLDEANIVVTPGAGFGSNGEGFFRISAFNGCSFIRKGSRDDLRSSLLTF